MCYQRSVELFRETGDRPNESTTLTSLGNTYDAAGQPHRARAAWQQALDILDQLGQDTDQLRARLRDIESRYLRPDLGR
jgi:tetratricopeptide (TPR) repeat protein